MRSAPVHLEALAGARVPELRTRCRRKIQFVSWLAKLAAILPISACEGSSDTAASRDPLHDESGEGSDDGPPRGEENDPDTCTDMIDNDLDGRTDCEDIKCFAIQDPPICIGGDKPDEDDELECMDGRDNDQDLYDDCSDVSCQATRVCNPDGPPETTNELCSDGIDNDDNGFIDCYDYNCSIHANVPFCNGPEDSAASCTDGIDNDDDGYTDCGDSVCNSLPEIGCRQEISEKACSDGIDNDDDGYVDCSDFGCFAADVCKD